jgi:DNA modification methylase
MEVTGGLERFINQIVEGDCRELLPQLPDECVDLIVTSPHTPTSANTCTAAFTPTNT